MIVKIRSRKTLRPLDFARDMVPGGTRAPAERSAGARVLGCAAAEPDFDYELVELPLKSTPVTSSASPTVTLCDAAEKSSTLTS